MKLYKRQVSATRNNYTTTFLTKITINPLKLKEWSELEVVDEKGDPIESPETLASLADR